MTSSWRLLSSEKWPEMTTKVRMVVSCRLPEYMLCSAPVGEDLLIQPTSSVVCRAPGKSHRSASSALPLLPRLSNHRALALAMRLALAWLGCGVECLCSSSTSARPLQPLNSAWPIQVASSCSRPPSSSCFLPPTPTPHQSRHNPLPLSTNMSHNPAAGKAILPEGQFLFTS